MAVQGSEPAVHPSRPALVFLSLFVFLLPLAIIAGYALPGPAALVVPAALEPLAGLIEVNGASSRPAGQLYLANLHLSAEPRLGQYLLARLQTDIVIVPRHEVLPTDVDRVEFQRLGERLLAESQAIATIVALRKVGAEVSVGDAQVRVATILPGTPAELELQAGDVIEAVDGEAIRAAVELVSIVHSRADGQLLSIRVRRQGRRQVVTLPASRGPLDTGGPVLGLMLVTSGLNYQAPVDIEIDPAHLAGGPASGLMYALGVYNAVATEDITRGHRIAGSGTLRLNGEVGTVDHIALKVRAAEAAGVEYFLAPAADAVAAGAVADRMKVIPVHTFGQALSALREIDSEEGLGPQVVPAGGDTTLAWLPR